MLIVGCFVAAWRLLCSFCESAARIVWDCLEVVLRHPGPVLKGLGAELMLLVRCFDASVRLLVGCFEAGIILLAHCCDACLICYEAACMLLLQFASLICFEAACRPASHPQLLAAEHNDDYLKTHK